MARERLQILLEYERKLGSQIDLFAVLREEAPPRLDIRTAICRPTSMLTP
jgi:hypothetical protein